VFNVVWHPLFDYILASGSDDSNIRVWDIKNVISSLILKNGCKVLTGHTSNVRAIEWNTEIPWIMVSGSWDASIRVWDIRTNSAIFVLWDHNADVYGLATHKDRPLIYASCSRDTSIRFWSLEGFISPIMLKLLVKKTPLSVICDAHDSMNPDSDIKFCGAKSRAIFEN
jgi:WD40 repeat protein